MCSVLGGASGGSMDSASRWVAGAVARGRARRPQLTEASVTWRQRDLARGTKTWCLAPLPKPSCRLITCCSPVHCSPGLPRLEGITGLSKPLPGLLRHPQQCQQRLSGLLNHPTAASLGTFAARSEQRASRLLGSPFQAAPQRALLQYGARQPGSPGASGAPGGGGATPPQGGARADGRGGGADTRPAVQTGQGEVWWVCRG